MILLNRLAVGLYFTLAGVHKFNGGITQFVNGPYAEFTPSWVPSVVAVPWGYTLPFLEVGVGVMMMIGLLTRWVSIAMLLVLLDFTFVLIITGKFFSLPGPMHPNVMMITICLLLSVLGAGRFSLDGWRKQLD